MFILKLIIVIHNYLNLSSYHFRTPPSQASGMFALSYIALLSMFMCVYNMHIYIQSLYILKYILYLHIFAISIQKIIAIKFLSKERSNFFFKLCRKENKVEVKGSKGHYFKFPSPYCFIRTYQEALTFFSKNSPQLLCHKFLKFHKTLIVFF